MGRAQRFEPGPNAVRLVIDMLPGETEMEEDGTTTKQYVANALVVVNGERQVFTFKGGARINWGILPAQTNNDVEDQAKAALGDQTGHVWRAGTDRANLFGGRTS